MPSTTFSWAGLRRRPPGRLLASGGFTLIELVTTIVIIGILIGVTAPRFFDGQVFSERGYADEVAGAMRYAQRIATASRCPVRIVIDGAGGYSATQLTGCTIGAWTSAVRRVDGTNLVGTAPDAVALAPAVTLDFDADGSVSSGAALNVNARFFINVDATTGNVTTAP